MKIVNSEQRSEQWFAEKLGKPSASCFDRIVTAKGAASKQSDGYMYELAGQRITGKHEEGFTNAAMQRGVDLEDEARDLFELVTGLNVMQVGLVYEDSGQYLCSPDGLIVNESVGLEIKCPTMKTHVEYLIKDQLPATYFHQVQGSMLVTGFSYWYFMSYYPAMPVFIKIINRDAQFCAALSSALDQFCADLDSLEEQLRNMK